VVVGSRVDLWFGGLELLDVLGIYGALCFKIVTFTCFYINETLLHSQRDFGPYLVVSLSGFAFFFFSMTWAEPLCLMAHV
jgi:hypothetical protein